MITSTRSYWRWLLGLALTEIVSLTAFQLSKPEAGIISPMGITFGLMIAGAFFLAIRRPVWLAWVTVAEIVVGGKGYVFWLDFGNQKISIRIALFVVLMIAAGWHYWRRSRKTVPRPLARIIIGILGWVGVMSIVGVIRGYGLSAVYADMNGYVYLAILWPWWIFLRQDENWRERLTVILLAGATIIGLKTWLMQLLFAQAVPLVTDLYRWIRQTGIGEITLISKNVYRIFFQSQLYALLGLVLIIAAYVKKQTKPWWGIALLGASLGAYLSLSRSLWLGATVGLLSIFLAVRQLGWSALRRASILLPVGLFVWLMSTWALNFPYIISPPGRPSNADAVVARLTSAGSGEASTARANQLPPLVSAIRQNPVTGHGFGASLTYYSTDPRIRGVRTTSAFELGYLDMAFHFGLVGLALFAWWGWEILRRLWRHPSGFIWIWPTLAVAAVHLTSPYLNHPLGLGWLGLVSLIAYDHE